MVSAEWENEVTRSVAGLLLGGGEGVTGFRCATHL